MCNVCVGVCVLCWIRAFGHVKKSNIHVAEHFKEQHKSADSSEVKDTALKVFDNIGEELRKNPETLANYYMLVMKEVLGKMKWKEQHKTKAFYVL